MKLSSIKLAVISKSDMLEEALRFNLVVAEISTFRPEDAANIADYDLIIADCRVPEAQLLAPVKTFLPPLNLGFIIREIKNMFELQKSISLSRSNRILNFKGERLQLTEYEFDILEVLLKLDTHKAPISDFTQHKTYSFEALKSMVYRLNTKFKQNNIGANLQIADKYLILKI